MTKKNNYEDDIKRIDGLMAANRKAAKKLYQTTIIFGIALILAGFVITESAYVNLKFAFGFVGILVMIAGLIHLGRLELVWNE